jgi:hypothetical protein
MFMNNMNVTNIGKYTWRFVRTDASYCIWEYTGGYVWEDVHESVQVSVQVSVEDHMIEWRKQYESN